MLLPGVYVLQSVITHAQLPAFPPAFYPSPSHSIPYSVPSHEYLAFLRLMISWFIL